MSDAPHTTPATQALLTDTVEDLVRERLRALGVDPDNPAGAGQRDKNDPAWDAEARAAYMAREAFDCRLAPRHAAYLKARAAAHGQTTAQHLESILRAFYATDTWRAQMTAPTMPGQPAGTSLRT